MPLNQAPETQKQEELCKFKASMVYRARCRTTRTTKRSPASKNKNIKEKAQTTQNFKKDGEAGLKSLT